jgi:hypothetical protein
MFQHETDYFVPYFNKNQQFLKFHAGMCIFGDQNLVLKVCKYVKSGHTCTFVCPALNIPDRNLSYNLDALTHVL